MNDTSIGRSYSAAELRELLRDAICEIRGHAPAPDRGEQTNNPVLAAREQAVQIVRDEFAKRGISIGPG